MDIESANPQKSDGATRSKKKLRNDLILLFSVLAFALAVFLIFFLGGSAGERVVIKIDGECVRELSLYENTSIDIDFGVDSEFKNRLVIEDGGAYVSEANCPDGICKAHRAISKCGETVICLPHRLVIEIE